MTLEEVLLNRSTNGTASQPDYGNTEEDSVLGRITQRGLALSSRENTTDIQQQIIDEARQRDISPAYALAMFKKESNFDPSVGNGGLGQFTRGTAAARKLDYERLNTDTQYNIASSLDYLKELHTKHGGDIESALEAYNGGGDPNYLENVKRHLPRMQQIVNATPPPKPGLKQRISEQLGELHDFPATEERERAKGLVGIGEAALGGATAVGGFVAGLGQVGSRVLNEAMQQIAERGPITAQEPGELIRAARPNFYTGVRKEFQETIEKYGYSPRTEEGKQLLNIIGLLPHAIQSASEAGKQKLIDLGMSEDQASAIALSTELVGFLAVDPVLRKAAGAVRGSTSKFKSILDRAGDDAALTTPEAVAAAERLADVVQARPALITELQAARDRLTDTLRSISEQGPRDLVDALRGREQQVPQQQVPESVPTPAAPAAPSAVATAPVLDYDKLSVGYFTDPNIPDTAKVAALDQVLARRGGRGSATNIEGTVGWFNNPDVSNAQKQVALDRILATRERLPGTASGTPLAENIRNDITRALEPNLTNEQRSAQLRDIKARVKEGRPAGESIRDSLKNLGLTTDEIAEIEGPLKNVRARRAPVAEPVTEPPTAPVAPATFIGTQPGVPGVVPDVPLYNLTEDIPGHPKNSTVAGQTLEEAGFKLPTAPEVPVDTTPAIPKPTKPKRAPKVIKEAGEVIEQPGVDVRASTPEGRATLIDELGLDTYIKNRALRGVSPNEIVYAMRDKFPSGISADNRLAMVDEAVRRIRSELPMTEKLHAAETITRVAEQVKRDVMESEPKYVSASVPSVDSIFESRGPSTAAVTEPQNVPLQFRYSGNSPDAILYNESGLGSRTSMEQIRRDTARGRITPDVAQAMEANLRRQAELFGVPIEDAHNFTGAELATRAMQLAQDKNLELYRAKRTPTGIEYEQVPRDVVDVTLKLESGTLAEPAHITKEEAATYVADKTRPVGQATVDEITKALETNTDISDTLPENVRQHFKDMLELQREGMGESQTRRFVDIFSDILDVIAPPDIPPTKLDMLAFYGLTPARKAAALRLYADSQRAGISFSRFLDETNLPEAEKALFVRYLAGVNKPPLPQGIDPRSMKLDPNAGSLELLQGNEQGLPRWIDASVVSQRTEIVDGELVRHPPLYGDEVNAVQQARELREVKGLTKILGYELGEHNFLVPFYALRRMGLLDPIASAYRASERAFTRERTVVYQDLNAMAAVHDKASRERIGEYGYSNTLQGINILIRNNRDIPTLTRNEQITRAAQQRFFEETLFRINEVREAIGKEPIEPLEDYIPFLRTFTLAERSNMGLNLVTDSIEHIRGMEERLGNMQYPRESKRTGATYTAEFDSFKLLKDYADGALRQIHLSPFIEKLRELTQYPLPDTLTGAPTWLLSEHKPGTYAYLTRWGNFLERGVQSSLSPDINRAANNLMSNLAGGLISLSLRSGLVHLSRLRGTFHRTGYLNTLQAIGDTMADSVRYFFSPTGTKWARNLAESQVLDSRGLIDSYDDISAAIMGSRPRDFIQALKDGEFRNVLRHFDNKVGFAWMRAVDNTIAQVAYNAARNLGERAGLSGADLVNHSDNHVVLTEGGTMPGDVAPIQYTTGGKMVTQFHRWTINNWNYFIEDVLGAMGRKDIARLLKRDPDRYVPAVIKSAASFIIATTAMNIFFEDVLHTRTPLQAPLRAVTQGIGENDSKLALAGRVAGSLLAETPIIGPTAHGFGLGGAVLGTLTDVGKQLFSVPGAYRSFKQGDTLPQAAMRLYGSPLVGLLGGRGSRQVGQIVKGMDRNDPLSSFYQRPPSEQPTNQRSGTRLNTKLR